MEPPLGTAGHPSLDDPFLTFILFEGGHCSASPRTGNVEVPHRLPAPPTRDHQVMDRRALVLAKNDVPTQVGGVAVVPIRSDMAVFREAMWQRGYKEGENSRI